MFYITDSKIPNLSVKYQITFPSVFVCRSSHLYYYYYYYGYNQIETSTSPCPRRSYSKHLTHQCAQGQRSCYWVRNLKPHERGAGDLNSLLDVVSIIAHGFTVLSMAPVMLKFRFDWYIERPSPSLPLTYL